MQDSKIEWTSHTFNPWRGCTKVSPGCRFCYAEALSGRNPKTLGVWGPNGTRVVAAESAWKEPLKWDREAKFAAELFESAGGDPAKAGTVDYKGKAVIYQGRPRAFCASLADVFESWDGPMTDSQGERLYFPNNSWEERRPWIPISECGGDEKPITMQDVRRRLFRLIDDTPNLDWLILTKRPQNIESMMPAYFPGGYVAEAGTMNQEGQRPNVWLGTSVENQAAADERIPHLLRLPAAVRFLSCEPLLGPIDFRKVPGFNLAGSAGLELLRNLWVIVGGESGPGARPCNIEWVRDIVRQCKTAGVACFMKQLGANPKGDERPANERDPITGMTTLHVMQTVTIHDRKGGDMSEWPEDLRVREFPEPRA